MKAYTQIPPGTQILIGRAARRRRVLERAICSVFEGWSYEEIIPPIFDYYDVFVKGMGTGHEEQIYRFIDREGNILALRPEFTSLVAKTVATRLASSPKPIRLVLLGRGACVLRSQKAAGNANLRRSASSTMAARKDGGRRNSTDCRGSFRTAGHPGFPDQSWQRRFLRWHRRSDGIAGRRKSRRSRKF